MAVEGKKQAHVLAVPLPAHGHIQPLMELSRHIAIRGIKVTIVNIEYIHAKVVAAMLDDEKQQNPIQLILIPDGLPPQQDRNPGYELTDSLMRTMPGNLTDLIKKFDGDDKITCAIADITVGRILDIFTQKLGVELDVFQSVAAVGLAMLLRIQQVLQDGNLDINDDIPPWRPDKLVWSFPGDLKTQTTVFESYAIAGNVATHAKWLLCNTFYELKPSACNLIPNCFPIGPLLSLSNNKSKSSTIGGTFWLEDTTSVSWLDAQPVGSVVYVSFGSVAALSQEQLIELALALELSGWAFPWVIRSNIANGSSIKYPNWFLERVAKRGKIVEWAPQETVLAHPSIACFVSHCGWNSTLEGIATRVPFLCWPYFQINSTTKIAFVMRGRFD